MTPDLRGNAPPTFDEYDTRPADAELEALADRFERRGALPGVYGNCIPNDSILDDRLIGPVGGTPPRPELSTRDLIEPITSARRSADA